MDRKEAIEIVRMCCPRIANSECAFETAMRVLVPELKESEDERIRKAIIEHYSGMHSATFPLRGLSREEYIAWLEKQGEKEYALKSSKDEDVHKFVQYIERQAKAYELNLPNRSYDIYGFAKDILSWLEKQGEQKPHNICDTCENRYSCVNPCPVKLVGQNPSDKIEPKFKVGDWVVYNRNDSSREILYVYDIRDDRYYFNDNVHFSWSVKECDEKSHLWTIQDAKDGDVLATDTTLYIFKYCNGKNLIKFYCSIPVDGTIYEWNFKEDECYTNIYVEANIHPATKEQRDLLFQKMKEAGYEWDAEKKELRKIEQKPAWSEEDEKILGKCIDAASGYYLPEDKQDMKDWLRAIKDRVQPKQEWSEEDEQYLLVCKNALAKYQTTDKWDTHIIFDWLENKFKSLSSQNTWKPSDEQIISLDTAIAWCIGDKEIVALKSLLSDLKKLTE